MGGAVSSRPAHRSRTGSARLPVMLALVLKSTIAFAAASPASPPDPSIPATAAEALQVLPFIADDYPKALATARARKLPLFIEAWAPW